MKKTLVHFIIGTLLITTGIVVAQSQADKKSQQTWMKMSRVESPNQQKAEVKRVLGEKYQVTLEHREIFEKKKAPNHKKKIADKKSEALPSNHKSKTAKHMLQKKQEMKAQNVDKDIVKKAASLNQQFIKEKSLNRAKVVTIKGKKHIQLSKLSETNYSFIKK